MRILVTGGAGYVGSHCLGHLLEAGHDVVVYDNLRYGHEAAVPKGRLVVGDLADQAKLTRLIADQKIEAVVHFAALALVGESVEKPDLYYGNNVLGSFNLLEAMRQNGVRKIVFSSTCATYGTPAKMPLDESTPQQPINPYGFSKLAVERMLADYAAAYGFGYAALRYFNASGAAPGGTMGEDHTPESHLIPLILQVALGQRESIKIFGGDYPTPDGTCVRDYIHVHDLASAHLAALKRLQPGQGIKANLGTGRGYSVREVIEACRKLTGHPIPSVIAPRRPGDPPELVADPRLASRILEWQPHYTTIEPIIETAWRWHKSHPRGYAT